VAGGRIFADFHYHFSCDDGIQMGKLVAAQVQRTLMLPIDSEGDDSVDR